MRRVMVGLALALVGAAVLVPTGAQAAVPTIGALSASEVGNESALLEANLDPEGLPTTYYFQYVDLATFSQTGFTPASPTAVASAGAGTTLLGVSAPLVGLAADTTYFFRLLATNSAGTVESKTQNFTTSHGVELLCEGDDCQSLPPPPVDPTLTTLLQGLGNPKVRYHRLNHHKKPKAKKQGHKPHRKEHHAGEKHQGKHHRGPGR